MAGPRTVAGRTTQSTSRAVGEVIGISIPVHDCSIGERTRSTSVNGRTKPMIPCRSSYEPTETSIICRYANGVKLVFDFLKQPFGVREPHYVTRLGTCPVRFVGDQGSVETGDSGEMVVKPEKLAATIPQSAKRVRGLDVSAHARNFFDSVKSRKPTVCNSSVMRTLPYRLPCGLYFMDSQP